MKPTGWTNVKKEKKWYGRWFIDLNPSNGVQVNIPKSKENENEIIFEKENQKCRSQHVKLCKIAFAMKRNAGNVNLNMMTLVEDKDRVLASSTLRLY